MKKLFFLGLIYFIAMNVTAMENSDEEGNEQAATHSVAEALDLAAEYMVIKKQTLKLEQTGLPENVAATNHFNISVNNESFVIPQGSAEILQEKGILKTGETKVSNDMRFIINALKPAIPQKHN
ncbi:MAG TPA: hypothetical protein VHO47_01105 [Candidatus Babeliales bacterium]|nr:hypothetical protein [Candidatus Babeliales bacterium]